MRLSGPTTDVNIFFYLVCIFHEINKYSIIDAEISKNTITSDKSSSYHNILLISGIIQIKLHYQGFAFDLLTHFFNFLTKLIVMERKPIKNFEPTSLPSPEM